MRRLQEHHCQVVDVLERVRLALVGSDHPESARIAQLRWELMRALREYQLFKHVEIFEPLIRAGKAPRKSEAQALKARCLAMAGIYDAHVRRWTLYGLVDAWPEYRADAMRLSESIRQHLARELTATHALLAGLEQVRHSS